jgi:hypothetical protein
MEFWLQIGSAIAGFVAAALWFWSAANKAPPMTYEGIGGLQAFLDGAARINRWAVRLTMPRSKPSCLLLPPPAPLRLSLLH